MSKVIAKDVERDEHNIVIVDGIRRPTDITYLQQLPGFHLIYITAESKLRYERLVARKENPGDENKSYEEFCKDEQSEADQLIASLGKDAEFTIVNNETREELFAQIEKILDQVKK
jgi:dephospho-CoA kinase